MQLEQTNNSPFDKCSMQKPYCQKKLTAMQRTNGQGYQPPPPVPLITPPPFIPPMPAFQNGAMGMRGCLNRNTYVWLVNGTSYWYFPTYIGRQTAIGFRWRGFGWIYQRISLNNIVTFQCF